LALFECAGTLQSLQLRDAGILIARHRSRRSLP
jgi:hypothetical protein